MTIVSGSKRDFFSACEFSNGLYCKEEDPFQLVLRDFICSPFLLGSGTQKYLLCISSCSWSKYDLNLIGRFSTGNVTHMHVSRHRLYAAPQVKCTWAQLLMMHCIQSSLQPATLTEFNSSWVGSQVISVKFSCLMEAVDKNWKIGNFYLNYLTSYGMEMPWSGAQSICSLQVCHIHVLDFTSSHCSFANC